MAHAIDDLGEAYWTEALTQLRQIPARGERTLLCTHAHDDKDGENIRNHATTLNERLGREAVHYDFFVTEPGASQLFYSLKVRRHAQ